MGNPAGSEASSNDVCWAMELKLLLFPCVGSLAQQRLLHSSWGHFYGGLKTNFWPSCLPLRGQSADLSGWAPSGFPTPVTQRQSSGSRPLSIPWPNPSTKKPEYFSRLTKIKHKSYCHHHSWLTVSSTYWPTGRLVKPTTTSADLSAYTACRKETSFSPLLLPPFPCHPGHPGSHELAHLPNTLPLQPAIETATTLWLLIIKEIIQSVCHQMYPETNSNGPTRHIL